jgi:NAD+ kinase
MSSDKTATLFTHGASAETTAAVGQIAASAAAAGWQVVATAEELEPHGGEVEGVTTVSELPDRAGLGLVVGGDGSVLRALRHHAGTGTPVFGINFGTMGFLAAVERDEVELGLARAFAGDYQRMSMPALHLTLGSTSLLGFNDITFSRRPHSRVAELAYSITEEEVGHVRCDGLVVSTPAGSTGYNLANHGPILAWGVAGYVVSYIAPHSLTARALVVAPKDRLTVSNAASRDPVEVAVDGRPVGDLDIGAEATLTFKPDAGVLAQMPGTSFYHRIREKFGHLAV